MSETRGRRAGEASFLGAVITYASTPRPAPAVAPPTTIAAVAGRSATAAAPPSARPVLANRLALAWRVL